MNHNQRTIRRESPGEDSDSSDESEEALMGEVAGTSSDHRHQRRDVDWCGVNTEEYSRKHFVSHIKWPPDRTTTNNWRHLRPVRPGNPMLGNKMQLFSRTNYNLAVYADGSVRGTQDDTDLHTHLELLAAGHPGHVRIQGILTKLYVAMDKKGRLYGEPDVMEENTVFIEALRGSYNTYLSRAYAHLGWYMAIKRSGKCKRGSQTAYKQKAAQFLPRRSKFER